MTSWGRTGVRARNFVRLPVGNRSGAVEGSLGADPVARNTNFILVGRALATFLNSFSARAAVVRAVLDELAEWVQRTLRNAARISKATSWSRWRRRCEVQFAPCPSGMQCPASIVA